MLLLEVKQQYLILVLWDNIQVPKPEKFIKLPFLKVMVRGILFGLESISW